MLFETPLSETCTGTAGWLRNFHYSSHKGKSANDMKIFIVLSESLLLQRHKVIKIENIIEKMVQRSR